VIRLDHYSFTGREHAIKKETGELAMRFVRGPLGPSAKAQDGFVLFISELQHVNLVQLTP